MMLFFAIMIATGVLFGTGAVVVDAGYGMAQQAVMQNAADAGAMAGAELMARNITSSPTGAVYQVTDVSVQTQAQQFANANSMQVTPTLTVTYLDCSASPAVAAPVSLGTPTSSICAVRVVSTATYPALLARAVGVTTETTVATATAQIMPTTPPTTFTDLWPITHHEDPTDVPSCWIPNPPSSCAGTAFWGNQADIGSFKEAVDMSRYSALFGNTNPPEQLFAPDMTPSPVRVDQNCMLFPAPFNQTCWDSNHPGTNTKQDAYYWAQFGWKGEISVPVDPVFTPNDHRCDTYATAAQTCPNARLETNITGISAGQMRGDPTGGWTPQTPTVGNPPTALEAAIYAGPIDPTCSCHGVTKSVIFWKYGEQPTSGNQMDASDIGKTWGDAQGDSNNSLKRIIVDYVRQFRFNERGIGPNYITGYFVGYYTPNGTSNGGTPNAIANTVKLVS